MVALGKDDELRSRLYSHNAFPTKGRVESTTVDKVAGVGSGLSMSRSGNVDKSCVSEGAFEG